MEAIQTPAAVTPTTVSCQNCANPVTGNFCAECGQKKTERLTFRTAVNDFLHNYFGSDSGIFFTIGQLLRKPGETIRAFLNGKRQPYTRPFQFYLVMLTLQLLVSALLHVDLLESGRAVNRDMGLEPSGNTYTKESVEKMYALMNDNIKIIFSLVVPLMALAWKLLYRRPQYNYVELLVAAFYIFGMTHLLHLPFIIPGAFSALSSWQSGLTITSMMISLAYTIWAIYQFFPGRGVLAALKSFAAYLIGFILFSFLLGFFGILYYLIAHVLLK